jgi:hypothetical protein
MSAFKEIHRASDLAKLPQWAQNEIARLRANVAHWKKLAHSATVKGETNVSLEDGFDRVGLPRNARITFHTPTGRIDVHHPSSSEPTGTIEVSAPDGALLVRPGLSNAIYIEVEPR